MSRIFIYVLLSFIFIAKLGCLTEFGIPIFEENFESENLNLSVWEFDLGNGVYGWGNAELEYYRKSPENIYIKNNQLHIVAKVENFGNQKYTSAKIHTKHTFQFTHGYVEAKIKVPVGQGIFPAFWMLGANIDDNIWPRCGEIDIMEAINTENKIYNTIHYHDQEYKSQSNNTIVENRGEFHIYGLKWTKDEIIMYIDKEQTFSAKLKDINTDAFSKPFYLLLNLAVGGNWAGSTVDKSVFPLEMVVDYIKVYQDVENYKYSQPYLIWEDDFNSENLDKTKWVYSTGNGVDGWGTLQQQYYTDRTKNVFLSNSLLHIKAYKGYYKGCFYTSGRIHTKDRLHFTFGVIEIRMKLPAVDGLSPGFFLSGLYNKNIWPKCGEIDALIGKDNRKAINSGCTWGKDLTYYVQNALDITQFHNYSIIWDKNYITIFADELEIYRIDISSDQFVAFHNPVYLNLNLLLGGTTVDFKINDKALPAELLVDYVRVYQYKLDNTISSSHSYLVHNIPLLFMLLALMGLY